MRLIYHLYDSDGDLEDDDLEHRHGHQVKRRASGRRSQQLRYLSNWFLNVSISFIFYGSPNN